jgi:hypothetical protein
MLLALTAISATLALWVVQRNQTHGKIWKGKLTGDALTSPLTGKQYAIAQWRILPDGKAEQAGKAWLKTDKTQTRLDIQGEITGPQTLWKDSESGEAIEETGLTNNQDVAVEGDIETDWRNGETILVARKTWPATTQPANTEEFLIGGLQWVTLSACATAGWIQTQNPLGAAWGGVAAMVAITGAWAASKVNRQHKSKKTTKTRAQTLSREHHRLGSLKENLRFIQSQEGNEWKKELGRHKTKIPIETLIAQEIHQCQDRIQQWEENPKKT